MAQSEVPPFIQALFGGAPAEAPPRPEPEVQIAILRERAALYGAPPPFAVGDLVMPRAVSTIAGRWVPHLVLEVGVRHAPRLNERCYGTSAYGVMPDVRLVVVSGEGPLGKFWVEHDELEPYYPNPDPDADKPEGGA